MVCPWGLGAWSVASVHRVAPSRRLCPEKKEVRADLLAEFETGALPKKCDHGNLRTQFCWLKIARVVRQAGLKAPGHAGRRAAWLSQAYVAYLRESEKSAGGLELAECGLDKEKNI